MMSAAVGPGIPGMFGKLPAVGDFVSRRLPSTFVNTWDAWIQEALSMSRQQLADDWLEIYLTSPIWRFVMDCGSCGSSAAAGILMPSVDKVGRYFPLTLAAMVDARMDLPYLFTTRAAWFNALEELALGALEEDFQLEEYDHQLQHQCLDPPPSVDSRPAPAKKPIAGQAPIRIEMQTLTHMCEAFKELTRCLLDRHYAPYSIWSTEGSDLLKPSLLIYRGLPPATDFSGFLTGNWQHDGDSTPIRISPFLFAAEQSGNKSTEPAGHSHATGSVRWHGVGLSHVGKVRKVNEDAFLSKTEAGIWAVADGMGGHRSGDAASRAIIEGLSGIESKGAIETLIADVSNALQATNIELIKRAQNFGSDQIMGSTVVVLLAAGNQCAALWAGDSRLYRYRRGRLSQLTCDHCENTGQADPNPTTPADANTSNVITRALGGDQDLQLDIIRFQAMPGDQYLLCSDGLVKAVNGHDIETTFSRTPPGQCARDLIDLAIENKARDNVTVVVAVIDAQCAEQSDQRR